MLMQLQLPKHKNRNIILRKVQLKQEAAANAMFSLAEVDQLEWSVETAVEDQVPAEVPWSSLQLIINTLEVSGLP